MAEKKSPARGADFVTKIVKDPKNPPATVMLTGYLGTSSEEEHTRLYFDPNLSNYVEIPDDAILHTQDVPAEGGLGATHVWIKRDAQLTYGPAGAQRPKGTFLEGAIMQAHMPGAAAAAAGAAAAGAGAAQPTLLPQCGGLPSVVAVCPTQFIACHTQVQCITAPTVCCMSVHQPCVSQPAICTPHCPRTPVVPCITQMCTIPPQCPIMSAHVACPTFGACPSIAGCPTLGGCQVGPVGPLERAAAAGAAPQAFHLPVTILVGGVCPSFMCTPGGGTLPQDVQTVQPVGVCRPTSFFQECPPGCPGNSLVAAPTAHFNCSAVCNSAVCDPCATGTVVGVPTQFVVCNPTIRCPSVVQICQTQAMPNCQLTTAYCPQTPFCPPTPACPHTPFCPHTPLCPQTPFCPQTPICTLHITAACPVVTAACPVVTANCPFPSAACGGGNPGGGFGG
jgi:hypothetical protein